MKSKFNFGKWVYNNILLERWTPVIAGCVLTIGCGIADAWSFAIVGFFFCLLPAGLQALGYKPME